MENIMNGMKGANDRVKRFPSLRQSSIAYDPGDNVLYLVLQLSLAGVVLAIATFLVELFSPCVKRHFWRARMYIVWGKI